MLLYSLLHLAGYGLTIEELRDFRQWGSRTPGHPEYGHTPGVDATTGPLGQGFVNAVGMAMAAKMTAARFNTPDFSPIDHRVYAIVSDGDLMEGVTSEAASIAGHLALDNLVFLYDDNRISIDGKTDHTFTEDVARRFEAYGWLAEKIDGHDPAQIHAAIERAKVSDRPSLILARTKIGYGAPTKEGTAKSHGEPLGKDEALKTKQALGWPTDREFFVPAEVTAHFEARRAELAREREAWDAGFAKWREKHPDLAGAWDEAWSGDPISIDAAKLGTLPSMPDATRSVSAKLQQTVGALVPSMVAGSADLAGSTKAIFSDAAFVSAGSFAGRNVHFGVREHAMGAIANGMALYGSLVPITSTFLVFSDYMRPAIRVAALSELRSIYAFTHDSIFLGEDGPTHQPIEHVPSLRLIPNLHVVRPATAAECLAAWQIALARAKGPTALILTRQKLADVQPDAGVTQETILQGGYVFQDSKDKADLVLVATGSELGLAVEAKIALEKLGRSVRVVSMPCVEAFDAQPEAYRASVLLDRQVPTVVIEAAQGDLWHKLPKDRLAVIGIDRFGASAPDKDLAKHFGFTADAVVAKILSFV